MKNIKYIVIIVILAVGILFINSPKKTESKTLGAEISTAPTEAVPTAVTPTMVVIKTNGKVQIIKATYGPPLGFSPSELKVKAGTAVKLEVTAEVDGRGCMGTIMIPGFDDKIQTLVKGQTNVFEFTPQTPGKYPITCAMGVPHGFLIVE